MFSKGLSDPEEPAIHVRDLTGVTANLDRGRNAGSSAFAQGSKAARRVVVYTHRDVGPWLAASRVSEFIVLMRSRFTRWIESWCGVGVATRTANGV